MLAPMQLQEILYSQGFGTRRVCSGLVEQGWVALGEPAQICRDPWLECEPEGLVFWVQGQRWTHQRLAYLMLHKPAGYECSQKPGAWPSVYSLLPSPLRQRPGGAASGVQAVGRLDQDTTGLLLLSDDGAFIHRMASPRHHVPKVYELTCKHPLQADQIERLLQGVVLDDDPKPVRAAARTGFGSSSSTTPCSRRSIWSACSGCLQVNSYTLGTWWRGEAMRWMKAPSSLSKSRPVVS